jgi:hypothetical protein
LRFLRGIDTLTALGLCSEIGEWERFDHPDQLSAYLGIVPLRAHHRRAASARVNHQGRLHSRPTPVDRGGLPPPPLPGGGEALERRQCGQAPELTNISWRAQRRLNASWRQLRDARRKPNGIIAVAIARGLAAFCWEIAPNVAASEASTA